GDTLPIPGLGGAFDLVDHTGAARSDKDFRGRLMLVMFGYTECPDVCGLELQAMASALATLGPDAAKVAPLFVTVDPETDTPATLAAFLAKFDPRIVGLTGTPAAIEAATRAYRVHAAKFRAPSGGDQVGHSAFIYLMGRDGGFLSMLLPNPAPEDIVARVQKYL
ncbi:MAG: SCO family protein, partial [Rhodospirillales bacterium]|nr:SCO family protein [Rhodospirillales bacterium]